MLFSIENYFLFAPFFLSFLCRGNLRKAIFLLMDKGDSGILPLIFKKISNMSLFANYIGACPYFDIRLS